MLTHRRCGGVRWRSLREESLGQPCHSIRGTDTAEGGAEDRFQIEAQPVLRDVDKPASMTREDPRGSGRGENLGRDRESRLDATKNIKTDFHRLARADLMEVQTDHPRQPVSGCLECSWQRIACCAVVRIGGDHSREQRAIVGRRKDFVHHRHERTAEGKAFGHRTDRGPAHAAVNQFTAAKTIEIRAARCLHLTGGKANQVGGRRSNINQQPFILTPLGGERGEGVPVRRGDNGRIFYRFVGRKKCSCDRVEQAACSERFETMPHDMLDPFFTGEKAVCHLAGHRHRNNIGWPESRREFP